MSSDKIPNATSASFAFDWNSDETIINDRQLGIAVYANPHGDIVIRAESADDIDECVVIPHKHLEKLIEALKVWASVPLE